MNAPDWLSSIELITFDCFGTLVDWRAAFDKVDIRSKEDFEQFEAEASRLQEQDQYLRYVDVLKTAIAKVRPQLRPAIIGLFADDCGRMAPFADTARALQTIKDAVKLGVLANSDAAHQLDVMASLRMAWDVVITSQELRAYKPTDRAWDAILRMGVARAAVTRDAWMHVSASGRTDLVPARARGLKTCLIKRPGADERTTCDLQVGSLDELAALVQAAKQGPLLLEIETPCPDAYQLDSLRQWLLGTRLGEMRAIAGVRSATLVQREDGIFVEQYVFGGQHDVENYNASFAAEHRASFRDQFGYGITRTQRVSRIAGKA